jgi:putative FmdB family regulatory protein
LPTYEYACTACGHRLEAVQKFTDDPLTECPECGAALRKVYGAVGIVLKGSGFYKTDNRRPSKGKGGTSDGGSSSDSSSDGAKAADSGGSGSNGTTSGKSEKTEKSDKSPSNGSGSSGAGSDSGSSKPSKSKASTT